ncbi:hypothetical protein RYX36_000728, partial [Vicia faba]
LLVKCIGKVGAFAVVVRQTNIIWVLFVACISIIDISLMHGKGNNYWLSALVRLEPLQLLFDKQILYGCFLLHALV